ncbi:superfamily II DNA/RNA helicase [Ilumatobacter fluminis]|uniref:Superfamily II DNA/RNA helicase n=2 Tax=Ilumatobacter fluminis TaxID=467091 RepID=A0A4R7I512_9ACTN|nr:superfamily II DNA/RNA helicase [Ilumatobacter fluminis]
MTPSFADLGVPSFISDALAARGITHPFEIQAATVADGLAGRDVCGRAPTGSGKTIAFGVPLVATTERAAPGRPHALVLAPTRELADQITAELRSFSGRLRVDAVYGGVGYGKQVSALRRGVDILVACPGRLEDLIQRGDVSLDAVDNVVLDEADRMADMGFLPVVRRLLDQTADDRRTMLFSATLDGDVAKLTRDYQRDPVRHEVGDETPDVTSAEHRFVMVDRLERNAIVAETVNEAWPSIVFTRTRHGADRLARQMTKLGFAASPIHGGLSQNARNRALDAFTDGKVHALIATDVAARGIHVDGVASVVHYDPPEDHKTYIHRSGRTARAGAGGLVVSLVQPDQRSDYRKIQRKVGLDEALDDRRSADEPEVVQASVPTLAGVDKPKPQPRSKNGKGGKNGNRNRNRKNQNGQNRNGESRNDRNRNGESRQRRDDRQGESSERSGDRRPSNQGGRNERPHGGKGGGQNRNRNRNRNNRNANSSRSR